MEYGLLTICVVCTGQECVILFIQFTFLYVNYFSFSFFLYFLFFLFLFFIPGLASFLLLNNSKRSIASTKPNCLTMPYVYRFGRCNTAFIAVYFVNFLFLLLLPLVFILLTQLLQVISVVTLFVWGYCYSYGVFILEIVSFCF